MYTATQLATGQTVSGNVTLTTGDTVQNPYGINCRVACASGTLTGSAGTVSVSDQSLFYQNANNILYECGEFDKIQGRYVFLTDTATTPNGLYPDEQSPMQVGNITSGIATYDVYVTAPGTDITDVNVPPTFTVDYKDPAFDAGELPAATYDISVTLAGTKTIAFNISGGDLSPFGGKKLLLAAISTITDTNKTASPIKLLVATDDAQLVLMDEDTTAGARFCYTRRPVQQGRC